MSGFQGLKNDIVRCDVLYFAWTVVHFPDGPVQTPRLSRQQVTAAVEQSLVRCLSDEKEVRSGLEGDFVHYSTLLSD